MKKEPMLPTELRGEILSSVEMLDLFPVRMIDATLGKVVGPEYVAATAQIIAEKIQTDEVLKSKDIITVMAGLLRLFIAMFSMVGLINKPELLKKAKEFNDELKKVQKGD